MLARARPSRRSPGASPELRRRPQIAWLAARDQGCPSRPCRLDVRTPPCLKSSTPPSTGRPSDFCLRWAAAAGLGRLPRPGRSALLWGLVYGHGHAPCLQFRASSLPFARSWSRNTLPAYPHRTSALSHASAPTAFLIPGTPRNRSPQTRLLHRECPSLRHTGRSRSAPSCRLMQRRRVTCLS